MESFIQNKSLYDMLKLSAERNPDAPAFLYKGKTISYATFKKNVDTLAEALFHFGIKPGEVVTAALPNIPKTAYLLYACSKIGAILYLRHVLNAPDETLNGLDKTNSKLLFALDTVCPPLIDACKTRGVGLISCCPADELDCFKRVFYRRREGLKHPRAINKILKNINGKSGGFFVDYCDFLQPGTGIFSENFGFFDPRKTAVLLDSGGTSGIPKTVELSAYAINTLGARGPEILNESAFVNRYMMSPLPVFHCFGLTMGLHAMVMFGGCNVFMPRFSRKEAIRYLKRGNINYMIGVPAVYDALNSRPEFAGAVLKHVDTAFVGGDSLQAATKIEFDARMNAAGARARLFQGYGLSETLSVACVNTHAEHKTGSVGKPLRGIGIRAVLTPEAKLYLDDKNLSDTLPDNVEAGELCVSGDILMNGYYKDEAATAATFFTDETGTRLLKTGDLGWVDQDGYVFFLGRMKHVIKVSGESIFPVEIETLALSVKGVSAAAAFAVPDPKTGSRVRLAIEVQDLKNQEPLRRAVEARLCAALQKNALPSGIDCYTSLPRTKLMKIDIRALQDAHSGQA